MIIRRGLLPTAGRSARRIVPHQREPTLEGKPMDGSLPLNLKFCFEGQEDIGSPQLPAFIAAHRALLACDLAVSAD